MDAASVTIVCVVCIACGSLVGCLHRWLNLSSTALERRHKGDDEPWEIVEWAKGGSKVMGDDDEDEDEDEEVEDLNDDSE